MVDAGLGQPINANSATPPPPPTEFHAKEEPLQGGLAGDITKLGIKDLRVVSSHGERLLYSRDQSEIPRFLKEIMFATSPEVVVQPETREGVASILKFASSRGITVIPRGSGSSPFGGSVPVRGGIVVDVSSMDGILGLDSEMKIAKVQAGVRWADLDNELEKIGLSLNTTPSSKFSTVAGWVATGGMGLNSFSKGHLSSSVLSVELVTPDGSIRNIASSDPFFKSIFGSEGQLGVITAVTLSVRIRPIMSKPHLLVFDDSRSAFGFARTLAESSAHPTHIVYESPAKFSLTNRMLGENRFKVGDAIIVNIEGDEAEREFQSLLKSTGLKDEKEYLARYMWNERYFPMKIRKFGPGLLGSEVVVPLDKLPDAISKATEVCSELGLEPLFETHFLNDGRGLLLCYYVTDQGNTIGYTLDAMKSMILTGALVDLGAKPYSIGVWNHAFSNAEDKARVEQLRKAKAALDPDGVMNAGKYFSLSGRFGGAAGLAFSPRLMRPALKALLVFSPLTSRLMRTAYRFADKRLVPKARSELQRIADECAMCGACVTVCPAYLVVGDERVTARGKLLTVKAMARGAKVSKEHSDRIFLCMRCKACEQVCQSKLELISAYEALEKELEKLHGKDAKEIETFTRYAESTPEYDALVQRGLVLGAPKHGMGGGQRDV
ncbi:MAG: FAD-binding protein [Thermoplasmatota archaeon]|nr:FAD-binding protein [Candidatus Thermoplasmatota archaeon]MBU1914433.1 FAD-binding protein [Candidatus Thermoplasmatota archaeon]